MWPVNSSRRALFAVALTLGWGACAFRSTGLVHPAEGGVYLENLDGQRWKLVAGDRNAPVLFLDGHLTEVKGLRSGQSVRVSEWRVIEGRHGMSTWVGVVEGAGTQLGLHDRNSGSFVWVDSESAQALQKWIGTTVLLEGYVEGPQRVRVMYLRVLAPDATSSEAP